MWLNLNYFKLTDKCPHPAISAIAPISIGCWSDKIWIDFTLSPNSSFFVSFKSAISFSNVFWLNFGWIFTSEISLSCPDDDEIDDPARIDIASTGTLY